MDHCHHINTLLGALKLCRKSCDLDKGKFLHGEAARHGSESTTFVPNGLITMYGKCGATLYLQLIFDWMPHRDVVSWNAMIAAFAENGETTMALEAFASMLREGRRPDARTFVAVLKAVARMAAEEQGREVDGRVLKERSLVTGRALYDDARASGYGWNVFVANTAVDMFSKCGCLIDARRAFNAISCPSVVSWNVMLLGYADNGEAEQGMRLFERMWRCCEPDARTFVAVLKNCSKRDRLLPDGLERAMAIHAEATRRGHDRDPFVTSSLVDLYSGCGSMADAMRVFEARSMRYCSDDVVAWNALLLGFVENGQPEMAVELFPSVNAPDSVTFAAAIKACSALADRNQESSCGRLQESLERGMSLHSRAAKLGLVESCTVLATSLVEMYIKCGSLADASRVAASSPRRHGLWSLLIAGYIEENDPDQALDLFLQLDHRPDARSFTAVLKACGSVASIETAAAIHGGIHRLGLEGDRALATSVVDVYCRCGSMAAAQLVFDGLWSRDLVAWNTLLMGYSRQGDHTKVLDLFQEMSRDQSFRPDAITSMAVLTACSHCGLVDSGRRYFSAMVSRYGMEPEMEHYHCMVDMFGRANRMDEAVDMVRSMPHGASGVTWTVLLAGCHEWKDVVTGRVAVINQSTCASYTLIANTLMQQ